MRLEDVQVAVVCEHGNWNCDLVTFDKFNTVDGCFGGDNRPITPVELLELASQQPDTLIIRKVDGEWPNEARLCILHWESERSINPDLTVFDLLTGLALLDGTTP